MDLEAVEQRALAYLKQTANPIVPVDRLLRHLAEDDQCADVREDQLLEFLRRHELFVVMDGPSLPLDDADATELAEAGIVPGARVMLATRVPSPAQLAALIEAELTTLTEALSNALAEAKRKGRPERARELIRILSKADKIRDKLAEFPED
jgi:hypothetical protein